MEPPELINWVKSQLADLNVNASIYRHEVADDAVKLVQHLHEVASIVVQLEQELLKQPQNGVKACLQALYESFNDASEGLSSCEKVGPLSSIVRAVDLHGLFKKCAEQLLGVLRKLPVAIPTASKPLYSALANCEFLQLEELEGWNQELRKLLSRKSTRKRAAARLVEMVPSLLEVGVDQSDLDLVKSDLVVAEAIEEDEERAFLKGFLRALEYATDPSRGPAMTPSAASSQSTPHSTTSHQPFSPTSANGDGLTPKATLSAQGSAEAAELHAAAGVTGGSLNSTQSLDIQAVHNEPHAVHANGIKSSGFAEEPIPEADDQSTDNQAVVTEAGLKAQVETAAVHHETPGSSDALENSSSFSKSSSAGHSTIPARLWCPEEEQDTAHTATTADIIADDARPDSHGGKMEGNAGVQRSIEENVTATAPAASEAESPSSADIASTSATKPADKDVDHDLGGDAAESAETVKAPSELLDPMTFQLMRDPVILVETGMTFDRSSIEKWLAKAGHADPTTGAPLQTPPLLVPNVLVKRMVDSWLAQHAKPVKEAQLPEDKPNTAVPVRTKTSDPAGSSFPQGNDEADMVVPLQQVDAQASPAQPDTPSVSAEDHTAAQDDSADENIDPQAADKDAADKAGVHEKVVDAPELDTAVKVDEVQVRATPTKRSGKLVDGSPMKEPPALSISAATSVNPAAKSSHPPASPLVEKLRNFNATEAAATTPERVSSRSQNAAGTVDSQYACSGFSSAASTPEKRAPLTDTIAAVSTPDRKLSLDHGTSYSRRSSIDNAATPEKPVRITESSPAAGSLTPGSTNSTEEPRQRRSRYGNRFAVAMDILNKEPNLGMRRTHSNSSRSSSEGTAPNSLPSTDAPTPQLAPATPVPSLKLPSTQVPAPTAEHTKHDAPMGGMRLVEDSYPVAAAQAHAAPTSAMSSEAPRLSARGLFGRGGSGSGEGSARTEKKGPFSSAFRSLASRGSGSRESDAGATDKDSAASTRSSGLMEFPEPSTNGSHRPQPSLSQDAPIRQQSAPAPGPAPHHSRRMDDTYQPAVASETTMSDSPKIGKAQRRLGLSGSMMKKFSRSNSASINSTTSPLSDDSESPRGNSIMMTTQSIMNTTNSINYHDATSKDMRHHKGAHGATNGAKGTWLPGSGDTPLIKAVKANENKVVLELLAQGADPNQIGKGMMKQGDSPLIKATKRGNLGAMQLLLKYGASPNLANRKGNTPLELAVESNNLAMVHALLAAGADPNTRTALDHVPLIMLSAWNGNEEIVRALISSQVDVNAAKPRGGTALHSAALQGFETIVSLLLSAGGDVHKRNQDNSTPLFNAAMKGHTNIVKMLVKAGSDVNTAGKDNMVPLEVAIEGDFYYVVRELVEAGASVNAQTYEADAVPMIMLAAWKGNKNIVKLLVSRGADVNQKKTGGGTALHAAALQGHGDIVWLLLMAGGYVHAKNQDNNTPLHNAARKGHLSAVARLVEGGADVNTPGRSRMTPLHAAVAEIGNADVVKLLLKAGGDPGRVDKNGWQPLHYAAANDFYQAAELLARDPHCSVNAPEGIDNQTALFIAAKSGHTMTTKVLLKAGANPMARTKIQGNTALHAAMVGEHLDTIRVLVRYGADPYAYNADGTRPVDVNDHENCRKAVQAGLMDRRG